MLDGVSKKDELKPNNTRGRIILVHLCVDVTPEIANVLEIFVYVPSVHEAT